MLADSLSLLSSLRKEDLSDKRVLVRLDLDLPVKDGAILDDFRLVKALPTIEFLKKNEAKIILVGHIGRDPEATLTPVSDALQKYFKHTFVHEVVGESVRLAECALGHGEVLLLENVRTEAGEKKNDPALAEALAHYVDLYVNESFATAHRAHASVVGVTEYVKSVAGLQFEREVTELGKALTPESPSLFILGGAKFDTKLPVLRTCLELYDRIAVGGALANDFIKAMGHPVGRSLVSEEVSGIEDLLSNEKLLLPVDVAVKRDDGSRAFKAIDEVEEDENILDIGPESVRQLAGVVKEARFIVWNGPLGYYEGGWAQATETIAELVAARDNISIVGGGDTIAAIAKLNLEESFTHLSTGGGSMLEFLALKGNLPGVAALMK